MASWPLLCLLAQAAAVSAPPPAQTPAPAAAAPAETAPVPPPPPPPPQARARPLPPPPPPVVLTPFRLSLTYVNVLSQDGDLANPNASTNAIGIDMAFPSNTYVRNHLGLAYQWESAGGVSARGFRIDLISLGYPIQLVTSQDASFRLDLEPILTVIRGEIGFATEAPRTRSLSVESGFGLELSATIRHWFLSAQPGIDFRYWVYSSVGSFTGFSRLFPFKVALGHEF
jgi:hypothetical protein